MNKMKFAQYFTPTEIATQMVELSRNCGFALEPSSGAGAIYSALVAANRSVVAVEIDSSVAHSGAINADFFSLHLQREYDTVVMNPPYLTFKKIANSTKECDQFKSHHSTLGGANLYAYFIAHCLSLLSGNGEMIGIVPVDFLNSTSGIKLRKRMNEIGVFTDLIDLTGKKIFPDAGPDCIIFRFSLNKNERAVLKLVGGNFIHSDVVGKRLGDFTSIHVGAVIKSKNEHLYSDFGGPIVLEGSSGPEYFPINSSWIRRPNHKKFKLVCNVKTRKLKPFRILDVPSQITGAVLGIQVDAGIDIFALCEKLNSVDWAKQIMKHGGRYSFSQRCLTEALV